ncbi:CHAT domain-containing protein [Microcoleus sp. herbarium2]|uniref:CHAT domain-containing protein n=1 Tax=Microcoleus sp. herbarium2 TaxID=3055433 RepID=UPI002FD5CCB0
MGKLIVIRLGEGSFKIGFPVFLRIAEDGKPYHNELDARLPPDPELDRFYENLKEHGFKANLKDKYQPLNAKKLLNDWLSSSQFLEKWHELKTDCTSQDIIRVILQTSDSGLAKLPWHLWNLFENYPLAEMAFSLSEYKIQPCYSTRTEVRILAILGNSQGIDITVDKREFKQLSLETCFLPEKDQETIFMQLRDEESWDILFFAGHSKTTDGEGILSINQTDTVKIEDLENAVKQAVRKGLRLAIFNSCDGLGLAKTLASWNVPQVIVMRTPIPDEVAHKFLIFFLEAFVKNEKTLYLALRQARENLQGLEGQYPLASWLPVMYDQCFTVEASPTWKQLRNTTAEETKTLTNSPQPQQSHDKLHQVLQRLNYTHQIRLFRTFFEQHPIGAYLIHGEEESGQKWLLNRLMKQVPDSTNAKVISVTLSRKSRATYTKALWQELGGRVGLINQPSQAQVIDKVAHWFQNRTVVFIFDRLDQMPEECMSQFIGQFWLPLVKSVSDVTQSSSRLLMFLIDHSGCVEEWNNVDFAETFSPCWEPHIPVKLPKITLLRKQDLTFWIENGLDDLPLKLTTQVEESVRDILESSEGGLPQLALYRICDLCDCNWYEWEKIWLKH